MAVVAIVVNTMFLRQPIAERLPDVLVLPSILFAWGFTLSWRHGHGTARSVRRSLLALTVTVSALSAFAVGEGGARVRYVIEEGPGRLLRNARLAVTSMHGLPGEATADANGDLVRTARYVRACTVPSDRMMVGANLSPLYYFAERGFAGGQLAYFSGFYTSLPEQREILDTLTGESVPIVLLPDPPTEFLEDYALVAEHLQARYRTVGLLGQEPRMQVWVDRSRSVVRTHAVSGLPCFR